MKYLTAIISTQENEVLKFLKYHNIQATQSGKEKFMRFAKKIPGSKHVNFYNSETKSFVKQEKIVV